MCNGFISNPESEQFKGPNPESSTPATTEQRPTWKLTVAHLVKKSSVFYVN